MNKIAICFNGQIRSGIEASISIINYLGNEFKNIDFFIHTWTANSFRAPFNMSMDVIPDVRVTNDEFEKFFDIYKPINKIIEDSDVYYKRVEKNHGSTGDLVNLWHSAYYASLLRREYEELNKFRYDIVIRMRPDCIFPNNRHLEQDIKNFNRNQNGFYYQWLFEDVFQIGNSSTMNIALDFYKHGGFYGDHFWPIHKFYDYMDSKNIKRIRLDDNRITILRQEFKHLDPLKYYYHHSFINSAMFENINYAKQHHHCTYENLSDPHWLDNSKKSLLELFRNEEETVRKYFDYIKNENSNLL